MSEDPAFEGHQPRRCGEHRTVGPHRAWCYEDTAWCYPGSPCPGCEDSEAIIDAFRAEGAAAERARIVALLEAIPTNNLDNLEYARGVDAAIAAVGEDAPQTPAEHHGSSGVCSHGLRLGSCDGTGNVP